jgi:hypothetical protein
MRSDNETRLVTNTAYGMPRSIQVHADWLSILKYLGIPNYYFKWKMH